MDLRQLTRIAPSPQATSKGKGAILAPCIDDAELARAIADLRAAGETVVVELPGHEAAKDEWGCDRRLERKEGKWRVT
jgi:ATP phosphoribosyltransferase regulatory subunit